MSVEIKLTDSDKVKSMLSVLSDMMDDDAVPAEYKERIVEILSQ